MYARIGFTPYRRVRDGPATEKRPAEAGKGGARRRMPPVTEIPDGLRIGPFRLAATIGHGAFGKVKVGVSDADGRKVAVKIVSRARIKSLNVVDKVKKEIQLQSRFRHPHIVRLYKAIATPSDIFMFMEYVSGGELFKVIVDRGSLSERESRKYFQQLIAGLDYCHRHKVVHRDVKPENLLLDGAGNLKIADFGLSTLLRDGEFLATSCGSPNYASPEVVSGGCYAGPEVDVWSAGVILFAMVAGHLPFDREPLAALFKVIKAGEYAMPTHFSPELQRLIRKILVVAPDKRLTVKGMLSDPWFLKDLPAYLFLHEVLSTEALDAECVRAAAEQCDVAEKAVAEAVADGNPLDPLLIAYYRLAYHKHRVQAAQLPLSVSVSNGHGDDGTKEHSQEQMDTDQGPAAEPPPQAMDTEASLAAMASALSAELGLQEKSSSESVKERAALREASSGRAPPHTCHVRSVEARSGGWCSGTCELCPRWPGLSECIFGRFAPERAACVRCAQLGDQRDIEDLADFVRGVAVLPKDQVHPERSAPPKKADGWGGLLANAQSRYRRARWHLGIRSQSQPADIMLELYKCLRRVGWLEWQVQGPFTCLVRAVGNSGAGATGAKLCLYRVPDGVYLVDFRLAELGEELANPSSEESLAELEWDERSRRAALAAELPSPRAATTTPGRPGRRSLTLDSPDPVTKIQLGVDEATGEAAVEAALVPATVFEPLEDERRLQGPPAKSSVMAFLRIVTAILDQLQRS